MAKCKHEVLTPPMWGDFDPAGNTLNLTVECVVCQKEFTYKLPWPGTEGAPE